jgi:hypothetical protein
MFRKLIYLICLVFVLSMAANASADLILHWRFDEGSGTIAHDSSGNGRDGVFEGSPTWTAGKIGGALSFSGGGERVVDADAGDYLNGLDAVTVCVWIKSNEINSDRGFIIGEEPDGGDNLMEIRYDAAGANGGGTNVLKMAVVAPNDEQQLESSSNRQTTEWEHVAMVWSRNEQLQCYINGQLDTPSNNGAARDVSTSDVTMLIVGQGGKDAGRSWNGLIDDVRIYNEALTAEKIQGVMLGEGYPYALGPSPENGALYSDTWATLSWSPGDFAVSHDVYIGDDFDDVNEATQDSDLFRGNQTDLYFVVGFPGYPYPDGLVSGTTYYWRIDEVNQADPNSPWKGTVWSFIVPSKKAYNAVPANGSKFIDPASANLAWTAGLGAKLHFVYFSDDYDTVANATGGQLQGGTSYNPGPLELDKTYYWRVDESDGANTYTGDVWSFTTAKEGGGIKAQYYNGMNFDNLVLTRIDPQINFNWGDPGSPDPKVGVDQFSARWTGEVEAAFTETYTFYTTSDDGARLWVNGVQVVNSWIDQSATEHSGTIDLVADNTYSLIMEYYENGGGAVAQLRWSSPSTPKQLIPQAALSLPVRASAPSPSSGATGTKMKPILEWNPGDFAVSHEVYFGTDANAIRNADKSSPEYKGTKALGAESYDPGKLAWFTTYYWRVDEVNVVNPDSPWVGNVWSFTTGDFILIDDFEQYNSGADQIWYSWHDGLGYGAPGTADYYAGNGTGAAVGDETTNSYTEETVVHGGRQSMPLAYDNNKQGFAKYSETEMTLTDTRDWTEEGVAELSIWFRGNPASVGSFVEGPTGTYTMTATGTDIWTSADEFHYAFKTLTGAGSIVAKVLSVGLADPWSKAGVMIRETLEPGSKFAAVYITPTDTDGTSTNGCRFQARSDTDIDATSDTSVATAEQMAIIAPYWIKLERDVAGNFRGSYSSDGVTWRQMAWNPQNIPMSSTVYVGLALTAHNAAATCQAQFSNVTITGTVGAQWSHQDIGIISNAPEPLYVAVSNSTGAPAVVYNDDTNAATIDTWTEWVIPLSAFADQGINLTNVDSIAIGLGTRGNMTSPGGSGKMYIDDIRLYQPSEAAEQ